MDQEKSLTVSAVEPATAADFMAGIHKLDPFRQMTSADVVELCERGQCFRLSGAVDAVYVLRVIDGVVWVEAAKGAGKADCTAAIDQVITDQAKGMKALAMQTSRPGLVKKLKKHGWRESGWIMRKEIQ